jgi:hypothetical protein
VIRHPARYSILYVTADTGETSYAVVTVGPDASVVVTSRTLLGATPTADDVRR